MAKLCLLTRVRIRGRRLWHAGWSDAGAVCHTDAPAGPRRPVERRQPRTVSASRLSIASAQRLDAERPVDLVMEPDGDAARPVAGPRCRTSSTCAGVRL